MKLLGVLENIFTFDGGRGHEIIFVYDAKFTDSSMYELAELSGLEGEEEFTAHWINANAPRHGWPLYPEGLADLIGTYT